MNQLYRRTMDQITMPEEKARFLRSNLASHCSQQESEVHSMKIHPHLKRPSALLVAFILILTLSITAYAAGSYVVYQVKSGAMELPEGSFLQDLIDMEPDEVLPYENWTESNGEVTVFFDVEEGDDN